MEMVLSSIFGRQCSLWDDPLMVVLFDDAAGGRTYVDWKETATELEHVFKADLLGLRKEDVRVEVDEHRMLSISGQRSTGHFMQNFRLPENANLDAISAKMDSGVLTVEVREVKKETPQTRSIAIADITHDDSKAVESACDEVAAACPYL